MTSSPTALPAPFNLREVVARIAETHHDADPARLVQPVLDQIDPAYYEEALRQALHGFITAHVVSLRSTHSTGYSQNPPTTNRTKGTPRLAGLARFLSSREYSPARKDWILLADATAEDLHSMALKREVTAQHFMALATWYNSVADALYTNGVVTVADLPVTVQEGLFANRPS